MHTPAPGFQNIIGLSQLRIEQREVSFVLNTLAIGRIGQNIPPLTGMRQIRHIPRLEMDDFLHACPGRIFTANCHHFRVNVVALNIHPLAEAIDARLQQFLIHCLVGF